MNQTTPARSRYRVLFAAPVNGSNQSGVGSATRENAEKRLQTFQNNPRKYGNVWAGAMVIDNWETV